MIEEILFNFLIGFVVLIFATKIINLRSSIIRIAVASGFSSLIMFFVPYYGLFPFFYEVSTIIIWTAGIKLFVCRNTSDAAKMALIVFAAIYASVFFGLNLVFYNYVSI